MQHVIFHADVNSAFLSWEAVYRLYHLGGSLDLRTVPSAVGGDQEKRHGIILAKSIPAKAYGIQTGEPVIDARRKCSELIIVPPNYGLYQRSSDALVKIMRRYTDRIERYSIDEAFMDMTGCLGQGDSVAVAASLKDTVRDELGFTVNVGVSSSKLLAKMASDFKKPDMVHTLWPDEVPSKMWPLPVGDLFYVGRASERKLLSLGIRTIGELAHTSPAILKSHMKSHGLLLFQYANGIDDSQVVTEPPPNKGYGNSLTTPKDVTETWLARRYLLSLAETVSARLRADGALASVVSISIRDCYLAFRGHQMVLPAPTDLTVEIHAAACRLFDELWDGTPVRHLGIHTSRITRDGVRQLGMFDPIDYAKTRKAEDMVDRLRRRYGIDCVKRACFLESRTAQERSWIDHMGGGISREKRTVDYSRETVL